jgi:hypothetical protein
MEYWVFNPGSSPTFSRIDLFVWGSTGDKQTSKGLFICNTHRTLHHARECLYSELFSPAGPACGLRDDYLFLRTSFS